VATEPSLYTVGVAPHLRSSSSIAVLNWTMVLALLPTAIAGAVSHAYGQASVAPAGMDLTNMSPALTAVARELGVEAASLWFLGIMGTLTLALGLGMLLEYLTQVLMRQPYRALDGHGALMGALLGLMMPPTTPWWVLVFGILLAIVLGKQLYGGIGAYAMHPAVVGWLILLLSWPHHLYPIGSASIAAASVWPVGATLAGGLFLWWQGHIRPQIPLAALASIAIFSLLFAARLQGGPLDQILDGHVMLGAFFLATDATSSPANRRVLWIYGAGFGFLTVLIRAFGVWPDAVPFAVLLMNILSPLLDRIKPRMREVAAT